MGEVFVLFISCTEEVASKDKLLFQKRNSLLLLLVSASVQEYAV